MNKKITVCGRECEEYISKRYAELKLKNEKRKKKESNLELLWKAL